MKAWFLLCVLAALTGLGCSSSHTTQFGSEATFNNLTCNLDTIVEADMDQSYGAAQGALADMQFTVESKAKDVNKAIILSRMADKACLGRSSGACSGGRAGDRDP